MRILGAFLSVTMLLSAVATVEAQDREVRILVPAYFYPAGNGTKEWKRLLEAGERASIVAIVNPGSGPGKRVDPNYTEIFRLAQSSKVTLIGYVTLSYAKRPSAEVKAEIDTWVKFYPEVKGIFFDEQPSSADHVAFVSECFAHAQAKVKKARLFSNPGTTCAKEYLDIPGEANFCLFENMNGFEKHPMPGWAKKFSPSRFTVLLYDIPSAKRMKQEFTSALQKHFGFVYVTDAKGVNPWDRLPSYWDEELSFVESRRVKSGKK